LGRKIEVVPGRWLFEELVKRAAKKGKRVFLVGGGSGVAERAAAALSIKYQISNSNIKYRKGPWLNLEGEPVNEAERAEEARTIRQINKFSPDFLFVGFGCPKQEKWLARNLPRLKVGAAMTVGGAFDYLAGVVPAPPGWMARFGLEWLWRLVTQPRRIRRVFRATVVFPWRLALSGFAKGT
jgi:N-acetylglucosaminyldiphosphoundecaprenol N-acetyl-beta-D-mannosaminyltransferase